MPKAAIQGRVFRNLHPKIIDVDNARNISWIGWERESRMK